MLGFWNKAPRGGLFFLLVLLVLAVTACGGFGKTAPEDAVWTVQEPPLKTQWFDEVSPENALPEYPRPQLTREKR